MQTSNSTQFKNCVTTKYAILLNQCLRACNTDTACTYWQVDTRPRPATAAVPAVPAQVKLDHDCPDPNLGPGELRKAFGTIEECYGYCNATRFCKGFVWDTVASELGPTGQCPPHGAKTGQACCILKAKPCANFVAKKGDTAVSYGAPAIPAQQAMPGAGCTLHAGAPAVQQFFPNSSVASGVKGVWSLSRSASGTTELHHKRSNEVSDDSSRMDPASALGEYTLRGDGVADATVSSAASAQDLWADFAADGALNDGVAAAAGSGAVAASVVVPPKQTKTVTLVFTWRFAERNYVSEELGNFYSEIVSSSSAAGEEMVSRNQEIASEGASFNQLFTNSTLPAWFQDFLINSLATQPKMGVWVTKQCSKCQQNAPDQNANRARLENGRLPGGTANGRYRTYEAFSGCDLDPVLVSDYHQIP